MELINPVAIVREGVEASVAFKRTSAAIIVTEISAQMRTDALCEAEEVILSSMSVARDDQLTNQQNTRREEVANGSTPTRQWQIPLTGVVSKFALVVKLSVPSVANSVLSV